MHKLSQKKLFWFLKEHTEFNLSDPRQLDMYIQQIITHGNIDDIRTLLNEVDFSQFKASIKRLTPFIPFEVRKFWEHFIGNNK